jgi:hypothetical protein
VNSLDPAQMAGPAERHAIPWARGDGKSFLIVSEGACDILMRRSAVQARSLSLEVIMAVLTPFQGEHARTDPRPD